MPHQVIASQVIEHITSSLETGWGAVQNLMNNKNVSVAQVEIHGKNKEVINHQSDSYYYVLEGVGKFTINGEENYVRRGSLIYIPKDTEYFDEGDLNLLVFNVPPFNPESVEEL